MSRGAHSYPGTVPQSSRVFARETNTAGGTTNWRVQGGMQSAAMAAEGKAKTAKASRKVSHFRCTS